MGVQERIAEEGSDLRAIQDENRRRGPRQPVAADEMSAAPEMERPGHDPEAPRGRFLENGEERVPFGDQEQQLAWPPIPGFRLYWFNDAPGRVARAKRGGYEHVIGEDGEPVTRMVDRGERGTGVKGYLMKIPQQWYDEDQDGKHRKQAEKMQEILEGRMGATPGQNQYVPAQGISGIQVQRR